MPFHIKSVAPAPQPIVDEWGIYDPEQAGLAAVLNRLETKPNADSSPGDARSMFASLRDVKSIHEEA